MSVVNSICARITSALEPGVRATHERRAPCARGGRAGSPEVCARRPCEQRDAPRANRRSAREGGRANGGRRRANFRGDFRGRRGGLLRRAGRTGKDTYYTPHGKGFRKGSKGSAAAQGGPPEFETDPADLQPKIRRLNRDVAAFLRSNPPSGIEQERLHRCLDAVESPWPRREGNLLRLAWERELTTSGEKARHLVEEVERIGAEPFHSPDPLPPIAEDEIHLITWMAIERENAEGAG